MSESNGYATIETFDAIAARRHGDAIVPHVGKVRLQSITAAELMGGDDDETSTESAARLIQLCVINGDGHRLFCEADIQTILGWDAGVMMPLARACEKHCGLSGDDEETLKNSEATTGDDLP